MRFSTLQAWLDWQETLQPQRVDLRLDRIRAVLARLGWKGAPWTVVTIAGTNGKGSCVAFLEAILRAAGARVGSYTSPHLLRYNERIRIEGLEVADAEICEAFARIDAVRREIGPTYFEFGTLAALHLFQRAALDVVLLEVGLGGRLDAVNAVDADVALVSTIDIDHIGWLGSDREAIGREKAGIFRAQRAAVCADPDPPLTLTAHAEGLGARLSCLGRDFDYERTGKSWNWWCGGRRCEGLPLPPLPGAFQLQNVSGVLMALEELSARHPVSDQAVRTGLRQVRLPMRCQVVPGPVTLVVDVAHNPQAVRGLASIIDELRPAGNVHAVFGMLSDKDILGTVAAMANRVAIWHTARVRSSRGADGDQVRRAIENALDGPTVRVYEDVRGAMAGARSSTEPGDLIVAFGSFFVVAELMEQGLVG